MRENLRATKKEYAKTEDDLKSLQSVGQIIGEVLRPLDNERCKYPLSWLIFIYFFTPRNALLITKCLISFFYMKEVTKKLA